VATRGLLVRTLAQSPHFDAVSAMRRGTPTLCPHVEIVLRFALLRREFHGFMCHNAERRTATETTNMNNRPLNELTNAAKATQTALGLKYTPEVFRDEASAFSAASHAKARTVMLGEDAFWVVCLADAARLEKAGFEYAPRR
jgi:hypothetical protein